MISLINVCLDILGNIWKNVQVNKHLFSAASFAKLLVDSEIEFQSKLVLVFCVILLKCE